MSDYVRGTHSWRVEVITEQISDRLSNIKKKSPEHTKEIEEIADNLKDLVLNYASRYATMRDNKNK